MFMQQTIQEYLDNPMGRGSTAIANRNLIKSDLDKRYSELIKIHKKFQHDIYLVKGTYVIHLIIPSESKRENTYDVVIQLHTNEPDIERDTHVKRYVMKVFSNCPSFTYTYAYVYNDYDLLIPELKTKYESIILKQNPIVKNPGEVINYDKSIYFACKYIYDNGLTNKLRLDSFGKKTTMKKVSENIRPTDVIQAEIQKEQIRIRAIKLKEKDDRANLRKRKDYTKEKDLNKLKVKKVTPIAKVKKVTPKKKFKVSKI